MGRYDPYGLNAQRQARMRGNVIGPQGGRWNPNKFPADRPSTPGRLGPGRFRPPMRPSVPGRLGPRNPGGPGAWGEHQIGENNYRPGGFVPTDNTGVTPGYGTGFIPPGGITINVGTGETAGVRSSGGGQQSGQRNRKRQALQRRGPVQRRYGQEQGMGRGYQSPRPRIRRSPTDYAPQQATNTSGYAPATSGMYGGRPSTMRDQWSSKASVTAPFGGRSAVKRYYEPQAY